MTKETNTNGIWLHIKRRAAIGGHASPTLKLRETNNSPEEVQHSRGDDKGTPMLKNDGLLIQGKVVGYTCFTAYKGRPRPRQS